MLGNGFCGLGSLLLNGDCIMIRPVGDYIFAKRVETPGQIGIIIVPDAAREKAQEAEVFAVGPGKTNDQGVRLPLLVSVGDSILFGKWSGLEIRVEGEDYLILREAEVLAII